MSQFDVTKLVNSPHKEKVSNPLTSQLHQKDVIFPPFPRAEDVMTCSSQVHDLPINYCSACFSPSAQSGNVFHISISSCAFWEFTKREQQRKVHNIRRINKKRSTLLREMLCNDIIIRSQGFADEVHGVHR